MFAWCDMFFYEPLPRLLDLAELAIGQRCRKAFDLPSLETIGRGTKDVDATITL